MPYALFLPAGQVGAMLAQVSLKAIGKIFGKFIVKKFDRKQGEGGLRREDSPGCIRDQSACELNTVAPNVFGRRNLHSHNTGSGLNRINGRSSRLTSKMNGRFTRQTSGSGDNYGSGYSEFLLLRNSRVILRVCSGPIYFSKS